jgi:hypothetical protein
MLSYLRYTQISKWSIFFYQNNLLSLLKYYLKEGVCLFKNSSGSAIHENG